MTPRDRLAEARTFLAASTTSTDADLCALYLAKARLALNELLVEVESFGRDLAAVEAELVRAAKAEA